MGSWINRVSDLSPIWLLTRPGIEPRSPGPLLNTLLIRLMAQHTNNKYLYLIIIICLYPVDGFMGLQNIWSLLIIDI